MPNDPQVTPEQLAQERSLRFALLADLAVLALAVPVGLLGGSLTIKAEAIRFVLGMSIEIFAYTVMWRLHRGRLRDLEFGGGKLEQIANLVTGLGMLGAAAWIATKAMAIVSGHGEVGTPLGSRSRRWSARSTPISTSSHGTACAVLGPAKAASSWRGK
jgi:divalent metal cation (Fe/Co/Zn/Cd) transporter